MATTSRRRVLTLVAAAAVLVLSGGVVVAASRSDDRSAAAPRPSESPVRVIVPGRPGEKATVTDSDRIRPADGATHNGADVAFVQMMIVHHGQAIAMARLAPERAAHPAVRALAARIAAVQKPEIGWYRAWLQARRLTEDPGAHDHATMPGMQSDGDLAVLAAARGADFDRRFVRMMTAHHLGAVRMAGDVVRAGSEPSLAATAAELSVEQSGEINRMEQLDLG